MIEFEFDQRTVQQVEKKLGDMKSKTPKVIKDALNRTAKQARTDLRRKAQETYTVKAGKFNRGMTIQNATTGNLTAIIKSTGAPMPITSYRTSMAKRAGGKAQILTAGGLKTLQKGNIKAFKSTVGAGHDGMFQRKGKERLPIKQLYSNSVPVMIGNEKRVYGVVEPKIKQNLEKNIEGQIRRVLGG